MLARARTSRNPNRRRMAQEPSKLLISLYYSYAYKRYVWLQPMVGRCLERGCVKQVCISEMSIG